MLKHTLLALLLVGATAFVIHSHGPEAALGAAARMNDAEAEQVAVEENVHEFMEYYNRPAFHRLKEAVTSEPENDDQWENISSAALTLAEVGNLLFLRGPQENRENWLRNAATVRDAGKELYEATQVKSFEHVKTSYVRLINNCNQCHVEFAGGDHQLQP